MDALYQKKDEIKQIKTRIDTLDNTLFNHNIIQNREITPNTISIVMTASNRSKQTYFTLQSIMNSGWPDIHIILVDDSTHDPITVDNLQQFPFYIDFININRTNKCWHNPVVNYNLGFKFIKGKYLIVQNAEVAHVGQICADIVNNIKDNNYFVYDVVASSNYESNEKIYQLNLNYDNTVNRADLYLMWYQGRGHRCLNLHFLTAMTTKTFMDLVQGFSYDYTFGSDFDDDDFLLKIRAAGIQIVNRFHDIHKMHGIHLYHGTSRTWNVNVPHNEPIFKVKKLIYNRTGSYFSFYNELL